MYDIPAIFSTRCSVFLSLLLFSTPTPNAHVVVIVPGRPLCNNVSFLLFTRVSKPDQSLKFPYLRPNLY